MCSSDLVGTAAGGRGRPKLPIASAPPAFPRRICRSSRRRGPRWTRRGHDRRAAWKPHNRLEGSIGQLGRRRSVSVDYGVFLRAVSGGPGGRSGACSRIGADGRRSRGWRLGRHGPGRRLRGRSQGWRLNWLDWCSWHSRLDRRGRLRRSGGRGPGLRFRRRGRRMRRGLVRPSSRRRLPLGARAEEETYGLVIRLAHGADHNALNSPITVTVDETSASAAVPSAVSACGLRRGQRRALVRGGRCQLAPAGQG